MEWTSLNDLRQKFLDFFEGKNHLKLSSFSLVPKKGESSLLLINSGMAPMKDWFLGKEEPASRRVTTCQKCIRTVDLLNVGKTDRHGTFFEMLGNFSFGDYFKKEAIDFAWEFITKVLDMPQDRLYVTVFESDDEALKIWRDDFGVDSSHIFKLGKDDNFWEIGTGPCGPCSEIYFDRGEKFGCGRHNCGPGCSCDRFVEFWNLVFSQYCNEGNGVYSSLKQRNIDTGMGLERLACIVQGVNNLFEVDSIRQLLLRTCELAGVEYGKNNQTDILVRKITDHVRSSVFLISDGVLPSNEGRGYVLRRLIRRACTSAKKLRISNGFLSELARLVANQNKQSYPELEEGFDQISRVLSAEEQGFQKILVNGTKLFDRLTAELSEKNEKKISADWAFKLCDTHGMPFDLLISLASDGGFEVDEAGFERLMDEQKQTARHDAMLKNSGKAWQNIGLEGNFNCDFVGYEKLKVLATLQAIFVDGGRRVKSASKGDEVLLIFDVTPFYAQSGGQIGDCGVVERVGENGDLFEEGGDVVAKIVGCEKMGDGVFCHVARIEAQGLVEGERFVLAVDSKKRADVSKNHTCAHLLHRVLRNVLGSHVHQAGQLVDYDRLRFDFSHFEALNKAELEQIELQVNEIIWRGLDVKIAEMALEEAKKTKAVALFDEKYGEKVRVVDVGGFSTEFCGGTHVKNSGDIGFFKIVSETSVGSGVRRIEAKTGLTALKYVQNVFKGGELLCAKLKVDDLTLAVSRVESLADELKCFKSKLSKFKAELVRSEFEKNLQLNFKGSGFNLAVCLIDSLAGQSLKAFCEDLISSDSNLMLLICSSVEGKRVFVIAYGKNVVKIGLDAGKTVRKLANMIDAKGGGKKEVAMAGVKNEDDFEVVRRGFVEEVSQSLN